MNQLSFLTKANTGYRYVSYNTTKNAGLPTMPSPPEQYALAFHLGKRLAFAHGEDQLDVALAIPQGQWLAVLGPSGAGKTTLLRLLAGLSSPDHGRILAGGDCWLDTQEAVSWPTRRRRIGFVFQDHALFPHMTVRGNVAFARPRDSAPARIDELLTLVGLAGLAGRYPDQLSGGQQQRLALARALATEARLLLLDEPLSALDNKLRHEMQHLLRDIRARALVDAALLVTHDAAEAVGLTDRQVHLAAGRLTDDSQPLVMPPSFFLPALS